MNRSHYLPRASDPTDRAILAALAANGRITIRELAHSVGMSAPSVTERVRRLEDRGVIEGYTISVDPQALGKAISAHFRIRPLPGELSRVAAMLTDTLQIVEADRVTGDECFAAKAVVTDMKELERVIDRFSPFAAITASIVQSASVKRRIPSL